MWLNEQTKREPEELLFKTTCKKSWESLSPWKKNKKKWGVAQDFLIVCVFLQFTLTI